MPKSRHRKGQKKKSRARTEQVKVRKVAFEKKMQEEFLKQIDEIKNKKLDLEEVDPTPPKDKSGEVSFEEVKS